MVMVEACVNDYLALEIKEYWILDSYLFARCRPYDDPSIKTKIDLLHKKISKKSQAHFHITEALKARRDTFSSPPCTLV
ncbi:proton pump-interactor BIP131-like [Vicia villosa]|uniref:proton pump-interactor BIP131-like n=1 Tax=Vicia villosa TaxID=3911 RepID=UPI00273C117C|nr:proton pump-interactor BIP131-like [Vicia villosa]